jgi:hypothetical protein
MMLDQATACKGVSELREIITGWDLKYIPVRVTATRVDGIVIPE